MYLPDLHEYYSFNNLLLNNELDGSVQRSSLILDNKLVIGRLTLRAFITSPSYMYVAVCLSLLGLSTF